MGGLAAAGGPPPISPIRSRKRPGSRGAPSGTRRAAVRPVGIFDEFGKDVLERLLAERGGEVRMELPVRSRPQAVDLSFTPSPDGGQRFPLLARMTREPCAFELVSRAPSIDELLGLARKTLNLGHQRALYTPRPSLSRSLAPTWVLAAGTPRRALESMRARPVPGMPRGFYCVFDPLPLYVVVIRELPETPDTKWLRVLGRGRAMDGALAEVTGDPQDPTSSFLLPVLPHWMRRRGEATDREEEAFFMRIERTYEEIITEAHATAHARMLREQLQERFGPLDDSVSRRLSEASPDQLLAWARRVLTADSLEQVFGAG